MIHEYIAIEGNIGSGKTSLANLIAAEYNAKLILEAFDDNPFLPLFYKNQERYAFPLELSFLAERFKQLKLDLQTTDLFSSFIVSDYILDKCLIFSKANLQTEEYRLYTQLFEIMHLNIPKPDLLVYLHLPPEQTLINIEKRGRLYEQNISLDYLIKVQEGYMHYFKQHQDLKTLIVDTSKIDFVNNSNHYTQLKEVINRSYPRGMTRVIL